MFTNPSIALIQFYGEGRVLWTGLRTQSMESIQFYGLTWISRWFLFIFLLLIANDLHVCFLHEVQTCEDFTFMKWKTNVFIALIWNATNFENVNLSS